MKKYLYHRVPPKMLGNIIYPLNQLKDLYPKAYEFKTQKYVGREYLLTKQIPPLNCLWNDVVFLLAANPIEINENIESTGLRSPKSLGWDKYFKIPVDILDMTEIVVWIAYRGKKEEFKQFDISMMNEYAVIPGLQIEYWKHMSGQGQYLAFPHIPHILYKGTIDITKIEVITI